MAHRAERALDDPKVKAYDADELFAEFAARKIAEARKRKGLSQRELGEKLGLPQSQISRLERNPDASSLRLIKRIAKALGVPVAALV